jgi:sugar/nucleoside kinase (ribokinase family)
MQRRGKDPLQVPAHQLANVTDTTGAGDAFAGAFLATLARYPDHGDDHALRVASAVASFAIEGVGVTRLATVTPAEVEERARALVVTAG